KSSKLRVARSPGVQLCSNGIRGRGASRSSRMNKEGREHRGRDSPKRSWKGVPMLVVGIDVGAEVHHVAVVDESEAVVTKPTGFEESALGYEKLFALLARAGARGGEDLPLATASVPAQSALVVMEASGHYWQNLFAALVA